MAWQTETDQDALQTMARQPAVDQRSRPLGLWERWHIAHDARWTDRYRPNSFSVMLSNRQIPKIVPALKMNGRYLYSEAAVDAFFRALAEQHASHARDHHAATASCTAGTENSRPMPIRA